MESPEFRFEDCVLDAARRELWRAEVRQAIEPKPFDLLHYLVLNRHRVVSQDELLAVLWPGQPVKPGALARAVMLARRAVGDEGGAGHLIQTSARNGYRFVGEVITGPDDERPLRLALLPFDNQTGDHQLDWVELGLMSLVARALASEPRLDVASTPSVLSALESLASGAPARERAEALRRLLGVQRVVAVTLEGQAPALSLRARWTGLEEGAPTHGSLVAGVSARPADLAGSLARQLVQALLPGVPAKPVGDESGDPLADEAMARALQAVAEQRWPAAVNLMRIVLDSSPDNETFQLELLRCQAALADPDGLAAGHALLQRAVARGDRQLQARVEQALGRHALNRGDHAEARIRLAHAVELAAGREPTGWMIQTLLWQSAAALHQGAWAEGEAPLEQAWQLCQASGNRIDALACLTHRAVIAANQGDVGRSMTLSLEVVQRSRELQLHRYFVDAAMNLAEDYACFGRLREAADTAEEAFSAAASLPDRYHLGGACTVLGVIHFHLRRPDALDRLLARLAGLGFGSVSGRDEVDVISARAYKAAADGDAGNAASLLGVARRWLGERGEHAAQDELLPWWLLLTIRAGRLDEAQAALDEAGARQPAAGLQAGLAYARAALHHAHHRSDEARQALARLVSEDIAPWSALAAMDAAWLAIEAGELAEARRWLDGLGAWSEEHPVALAVQARWHAARGDLATASAHQRRFDAAVTGTVPRALGDLGRRYASAREGEPLVLPAAPWLPTLW
jgi:DNA-binding winged helix-turn-helix (wHTH) protein/tetratricopeptide (TPR) repeat protein